MKPWVMMLLLLTLADPLVAAVSVPDLDIGQGGHCVDDPRFMRLNHMKLMLHQRDETVHQGIRGGKYSLAGCVDCHASKKNHSVLGTNQNFCQGCHVYAAVKIDCFECHSSEPRKMSGTQLGLVPAGGRLK
ncbi:MAG: hypothetical protein KGK17_04530 [Betaproteobacteria bacterium]|nr:hypothetical protein [Betaproteobacteria bacterium]